MLLEMTAPVPVKTKALAKSSFGGAADTVKSTGLVPAPLMFVTEMGPVAAPDGTLALI
jgi:hypothetical protein